MLIRVRPDSPVPIYEQIIAQLTFAVAGGDLPPGTLVPSVRDLAAELVVNPNTVTRAYQELERSGILISRRGVGMEVSAEAPKLCRDRRKGLVVQRLREALREAESAGLNAEDVCK
ncbi:MAG: GntR family transcriptional regulator, partial [Gemmataceae bacterium]